MAYDFKILKERKQEIIEWLGGEFNNIQTGMVSPSILDAVNVDAFGSSQKISHIANVAIEDPKTLLISPWDSTIIPEIESAIRSKLEDVGISVTEKSIRLRLSDLTGERRELIKKVIKAKLEESKKSFRGSREKTLNDLRASGLSEDDLKGEEKKLQEMVDETSKELEEMTNNKLSSLEI